LTTSRSNFTNIHLIKKNILKKKNTSLDNPVRFVVQLQDLTIVKSAILLEIYPGVGNVPENLAGSRQYCGKSIRVQARQQQRRYFQTFKKPRNIFQGVDSSSIYSLTVRYDNPITTLFLAPIDCFKIPALNKVLPRIVGKAS
jgi:hypothetical protein